MKYAEAICQTCYWKTSHDQLDVDINEISDAEIAEAFRTKHWRDTKPHRLSIRIGHSNDVETNTYKTSE